MAATEYTPNADYNKFLKKGDCSEGNCSEGCGCEKSSCDDDCSCCPVGLVAIYDDKGQHVGCVTPNDAELYKKNTYVCQDGYVKLLRNATGEFLGCVSEENFDAIYTTINGNNS